MKYLPIDKYFYRTVDSYFKTKFEHCQEEPIEPHRVFEKWSQRLNIADLEIMFEDMKHELGLEYYISIKYRKNVIRFINLMYKKTACLERYALFPVEKYGIFRGFEIRRRIQA